MVNYGGNFENESFGDYIAKTLGLELDHNISRCLGVLSSGYKPQGAFEGILEECNVGFEELNSLIKDTGYFIRLDDREEVYVLDFKKRKKIIAPQIQSQIDLLLALTKNAGIKDLEGIDFSKLTINKIPFHEVEFVKLVQKIVAQLITRDKSVISLEEPVQEPESNKTTSENIYSSCIDLFGEGTDYRKTFEFFSGRYEEVILAKDLATGLGIKERIIGDKLAAVNSVLRTHKKDIVIKSLGRTQKLRGKYILCKKSEFEILRDEYVSRLDSDSKTEIVSLDDNETEIQEGNSGQFSEELSTDSFYSDEELNPLKNIAFTKTETQVAADFLISHAGIVVTKGDMQGNGIDNELVGGISIRFKKVGFTIKSLGKFKDERGNYIVCKPQDYDTIKNRYLRSIVGKKVSDVVVAEKQNNVEEEGGETDVNSATGDTDNNSEHPNVSISHINLFREGTNPYKWYTYFYNNAGKELKVGDADISDKNPGASIKGMNKKLGLCIPKQEILRTGRGIYKLVEHSNIDLELAPQEGSGVSTDLVQTDTIDTEVSQEITNQEGVFQDGTSEIAWYRLLFRNKGSQVSINSNHGIPDKLGKLIKRMNELLSPNHQRVRVVKPGIAILEYFDSRVEEATGVNDITGENFRISKLRAKKICDENRKIFNLGKKSVKGVILGTDEFIFCLLCGEDQEVGIHKSEIAKNFLDGVNLSWRSILELKSSIGVKIGEKKIEFIIPSDHSLLLREKNQAEFGRKFLDYMKSNQGVIITQKDIWESLGGIGTLENFKLAFNQARNLIPRVEKFTIYRLGGKNDWEEFYYGDYEKLELLKRQKASIDTESTTASVVSSSETGTQTPIKIVISQDDCSKIVSENPHIEFDFVVGSVNGIKLGDGGFNLFLICIRESGEKLSFKYIFKVITGNELNNKTVLVKIRNQVNNALGASNSQLLLGMETGGDEVWFGKPSENIKNGDKSSIIKDDIENISDIETHILAQGFNFGVEVNSDVCGVELSHAPQVGFIIQDETYEIDFTDIEYIFFTFLLSRNGQGFTINKLMIELVGEQHDFTSSSFKHFYSQVKTRVNQKLSEKGISDFFAISSQINEETIKPIIKLQTKGEYVFGFNNVTNQLSWKDNRNGNNSSWENTVTIENEEIRGYVKRFLKNPRVTKEIKLVKNGKHPDDEVNRVNRLFESERLPFVFSNDQFMRIRTN